MLEINIEPGQVFTSKNLVVESTAGQFLKLKTHRGYTNLGVFLGVQKDKTPFNQKDTVHALNRIGWISFGQIENILGKEAAKKIDDYLADEMGLLNATVQATDSIQEEQKPDDSVLEHSRRGSNLDTKV